MDANVSSYHSGAPQDVLRAAEMDKKTEIFLSLS